MRLRLRAGPPGPGPIRVDRLAAGELEALGLRALDAVGARLALLFIATALAGITLAAHPGDAGRAVPAGLAIFACAVGVAVVLVRRLATPWVLGLTVTGSVTMVALAGVPPGITWDRSHTLAAWVVAGLASGVAASRGPAWGLAVFVPAVVTSLLAERALGGPAQHGAAQHGLALGGAATALTFLGALTYYVGAAVTHVLARRGFAMTERALEAAEAAETAQQVAQERWQARRGADRLLHDTVLATLTVLAHQGVGVAAADIRAACARDLAILTGGARSSPTVVTAPGASGPGGPGAIRGVPVEQVVTATVAHAAGLGLELRAHLGLLDRREARLAERAASALSAALTECVTNVRLHSGVDRLDLVASVTGGALVVLVVDEGCGFDPAAVPEDRLGLRASVLERLLPLGGSVTVWSRPGQGTSVKLRLPLRTGPS